MGEQPFACAPCTVKCVCSINPTVGQLFVRLVDLGQQRATGHRDDGVTRRAPAELFGDLESHRLGTFRVVGAQVHVDEAPAVFARDFRAQAIDLIISAVNADDAACRTPASRAPCRFPGRRG